ncbi:hypothetical protein RO575_14150 [Methylomonas sp. MO1]|uniref:hypothetical protein n=1 Tax=Methylomonas sp. MO1 TaxID=3073619 RepID=UPI0028A3A8E5|nr:hypothetical protein [Methylomonas sp. MO1]MDT4290702.1 hypothetical protein [Methylomonas sp. MO1]
MQQFIFGLLISIAAATANALPPPEARSLPLEEISLEHINIQGQIQTWRLHKVCIDGQAYLLITGATGPGGISAAYKDGKPEQCQINAAGK